MRGRITCIVGLQRRGIFAIIKKNGEVGLFIGEPEGEKDENITAYMLRTLCKPVH